jgi:prepilin-type N-terminal cleavage/methylation domain-containing protein
MAYSNPTSPINLAVERNSFRCSPVERNLFRYPLVKRTPFRYPNTDVKRNSFRYSDTDVKRNSFRYSDTDVKRNSFRYSDASQTPSRPPLAINGINSVLRRRNGMNSVLRGSNGINSVLRGAAKRCPRSGFTLIELLIVIGIMLVLVAAAATLIQPAGESRRIRETSRSINIYLSTARNHAMETGRSCGVIFRCLSGTNACALTADQCEVPPSYCGDTLDSTVTVTRPNVALTPVTVTATTSKGSFDTSLVSTGDLIQFNGQGLFYSITSVSGTTITATLDANTSLGQLVPWNATASVAVPYCIIRAPMKSVSRPLQLPAGAVVDLGSSGVGDNSGWSADVTIMFSPTGAIDTVNGSRVTDPIYLLIGKRGLVNNTFVAGNTNQTTLTNAQDLNNLWVAINSQTGMIETEPVAVSSATTAAAAIVQSRSLAKQGQGMGGK